MNATIRLEDANWTRCENGHVWDGRVYWPGDRCGTCYRVLRRYTLDEALAVFERGGQ